MENTERKVNKEEFREGLKQAKEIFLNEYADEFHIEPKKPFWKKLFENINKKKSKKLILKKPTLIITTNN